MDLSLMNMLDLFVKCTFRSYSILLKYSCFCTTDKYSVRTDYAEMIMHILHVSCHNGNLVMWTVVSVTTAKFKPLIFSMSGFTLSCTANLMIPYDFCLFPVQFCYIMVHIRKVKSCVQVADRCAPWKISSGVQKPCFACAAILGGRCLPLIRRREKRTVPYGEFLWCWRLNAHFSIGIRFWLMFRRPWLQAFISAVPIQSSYRRLYRDIFHCWQRWYSVH
jgi:hypothetical protein